MIRFCRCAPVLPLLFIAAQLPVAGQPTPWSHFTLAGSGPSLNSTPVVYDSASNRLMVFGGLGANSSCCVSDTWALLSANGSGGTSQWQQLAPSGTLPPSRFAHSAVYDQINNRMIIFGGGVSGCGVFCTLFNDVWVLSNASGVGGTPTWTQLAPTGAAPPGRAGHRAVYDPNTNRMTIFGGGDNGVNDRNDTWVLTNANGSGGTPQWIQLAPAGTLPAPREVFISTYDPSANAMTVFGGAFLGDLWILSDANGIGAPSWRQITQTSPAPGTLASWNSGYDPTTDSMLFFGGSPSFGAERNDVWVLKNANGVGTPTWTNPIPNGSPGSPPASGPVGTFDAVRKRLIIVPDAGDLWVLDATAGLGLPSAPSISSGGVVNAASYAPSAVAPGSIAAVFGSYPVTSPVIAPDAPWPTSLGGLSVEFGTTQAPLYYASGSQVNLQVPWELSGQTQTTISATANGESGAAQTVNLATYAPGIFSMNGQGTGQGAIIDAISGRLLDSSNPAIAGSTYVSIYCTGLGPVTNQPASGSASPSNPLASTPTNPTVMIGGVQAQVLFSGLAPGFVGEYQVNALVPAAAATGTAVPVAMAIGGVTSNTVTIAVQAPSSNGTLQVQITGLPTGTAGSVSVTSSNGFTQTITAGQVLQVPPGTYNVVANPVSAGNLTYYAQAPAPVTVSAGSTVTVQVAYLTAIPTTTKTLDPAGVQGLTVSADGSTITLPSSSSVAPSLAPGNVLAVGITAATPYGLLRKIVSVSQSGSGVVLVTTQATLADTFQQLDFKFGTALNPQTLKPTMMAPGVSIHRAERTISIPQSVSTTAAAQVSCTSDNAVLVQMLGATVLSDNNGSISTSGELDICPSLEFDLSYTLLPPAINSLTATATITGDLQIDVSGEYNSSFDKSVPLASLESDPIPVSVFGVPLVLTPEVTVFVGASGQAAGSFSAGATQTASLTEGISYASGQISPIQSWSHGFTTDPMALDVNLSAKIYAGVTFGLKIDEILTPQVSPEAFLQLDVNPLGNPWWTLAGGVDLTGGVDVSIIGLGEDFEFPDKFQESVPIAQAPGSMLPSDGTPNLQSISPTTASAGSSTGSLTVTGSNFVPGSVVSFGKTGLATTYVSSSKLTAVLSANLLTTGGAYPVTVTNPLPEAGTSQALSFTVQSTTPENPQPSISQLSQTSATAGSGPLTLTITGTGFIASSSVTFNGVSHTDSLLSATQLTIVLSASDLAAAGSYPIVVTNPAPGGGASNTVAFTVVAASRAVVVAPLSAMILPTGVQSFGGSVTGVLGGGVLTWSVQEGAAGGTIGSDGTYTAPSTTGTYHVVATNMQNTSESAVATVTVLPASSYVILNPSSAAAGSVDNPAAALVQSKASPNYFFGAERGGVFEMDSLGNLDVIGGIAPSGAGVPPTASLVQATDGNFYGTAADGGPGYLQLGSIFKVAASGGISTVYYWAGIVFNGDQGASPRAALIQANDGYLYGTTYAGGNPASCSYQSGCGTVFRLDLSGNLTVLHSFSGPDGALPSAPLVQGKDGNFYGTTSAGGNGVGTIFKMDSSGTVTVLHSFYGADGLTPLAGLTQGSDGNFYGTASSGGASCPTAFLGACGTVFRITPAGEFAVLYTFSGADGIEPVAPLLQASDGSLYGTTWGGGNLTCGPNYLIDDYPYPPQPGCGEVFRIDLSGNFAVVHAFGSLDFGAPFYDGAAPAGGLIQANDGNLYGTTCYGGPSVISGTVFRLAVPPQ